MHIGCMFTAAIVCTSNAWGIYGDTVWEVVILKQQQLLRQGKFYSIFLHHFSVSRRFPDTRGSYTSPTQSLWEVVKAQAQQQISWMKSLRRQAVRVVTRTQRRAIFSQWVPRKEDSPRQATHIQKARSQTTVQIQQGGEKQAGICRCFPGKTPASSEEGPVIIAEINWFKKNID